MAKNFSKDNVPSNGPIPGENFTSDTRNYPWHRPPQIVDLDEAIEDMFKKIMEPKAANALLTFLEMGMTVATATNILTLKGVEKGKWTPDMMIMLAGPTARMIELMAKDAGIKYRMGIDDDEQPNTGAFFEGANKPVKTPSKETMNSIKEEVKSSAKPKGFATPMGE